MSQLTVTALQLGLLALLWLFVILVIGVLRRDLFGPRVLARGATGPVPRAPRRTTRPVEKPPTSPSTPATPAGSVPPGGTVPSGGPPPASSTPPGPVAPPTPHVAPRSLVVTEGPLAGTQLPLGPSPVLIGRAPDCTLVVPDDYASSHHARLVPGDDGWVLEDLGSTNGTLLGRGGGSPVTGRVPVGAGSVVRIGRTVLELRR